MKTNRICSRLAGLSLLAAGVLSLNLATAGGGPECVRMGLAEKAISANSAEADAAIKALRAEGPAGVRALSDRYVREVAEHLRETIGPVPADDKWERIRTAFDRVGRQRDNYASQLYWFTDLDAAKAAARAAGKPILSLRLLGQLDEEYSCANSRFFRTTLYSNTEVGRYLRDHFILHWQSVRPVPRITIDMGDGRKIERTITGNSIHYVLDSDGRPTDALPGLYGSKTFLRELGRAADITTRSEKLSGDVRETFLRDYHLARLRDIQSQWTRDLEQVGVAPRPVLVAANPAPTADAAMARSMGKGLVETPMLRSLQPGSARERTDLDKLSTDATWQAIAALHRDDARLDSSSRALIQSKESDAMAAAMATISKVRVESPLLRMMRNLERSIAEDTIRNEYQLHSRIHEWFGQGTAPSKLDALNSKVYAELFLTPDSDPWLGLAPADTFSALDHGGLVRK